MLVQEFLRNYSYKPAQSVIAKRPQPIWKALDALIQMQLNRLSFDFQASYENWKVAKQCLPADLASDPSFLHAEHVWKTLTNEDTELAIIVELFRQLEIYLEVEDTVSFLIRFYRAREAVLSFIAKKYGVERTKSGSIHELFVRLEEAFEANHYTNYLGAYFFWKSKNVSDTMNLRNRSFIGHGRQGFSEQKVWEEYSGYAMSTVAMSKRRFRRDTALMLRDLGVERDAAFEQINQFIIRVADFAVAADPAFEATASMYRQLVLSGNYRAVLALRKPNGSSDLTHLLVFAENLQNCNVTRLSADLKVVMRILERHRSDEQELVWCRKMLALEQKEQRTFIYYLYSMAQLLDERENMVDFIVLYFRLVEELMMYVIGWDVDAQQKLCESKYRPALMLDEGERIATFSIFKRVLERYQKDEDCRELLMWLNSPAVAKVLELRHEGVSGHGFADLSRDRVLAISEGVEPLARIRPLLEKFDLIPAYSIIRLVDEAILLLLAESEPAADL